MKAHYYQYQVFDTELESIAGKGRTQYALYFPAEAILCFQIIKQTNQIFVDSFSDDPEAIEHAQGFIDHLEETEELRKKMIAPPKYLGIVDIPNHLSKKIISLGRKYKKTEKRFHQQAQNLIKLL